MKRTSAPSQIRQQIESSPKLRELRKRRQIVRRNRIIALSIFLLLLVIGIVLASRIRQIRIHAVTVVGNQIIDSEDILARVNTQLAGYYARVIPKNNTFIYPHKVIVADLHTAFPRLRNITIERTNLTSIAITVMEERGNALWCGTTIDPINIHAPCYFTDNQGMIIAQAPQFSGNVYLRFFGGTLDHPENPLGQTFLPAGSFSKLFLFADDITAMGFSIKAVQIGTDITSGGTSSEDAFIVDLGGGKTAAIKFQADDDYVLLASNLRAALSKKELSDEMTTHKSALEYFDLRFSNKVYYKFGSGSSTTPAPVTPVTPSADTTTPVTPAAIKPATATSTVKKPQ